MTSVSIFSFDYIFTIAEKTQKGNKNKNFFLPLHKPKNIL